MDLNNRICSWTCCNRYITSITLYQKSFFVNLFSFLDIPQKLVWHKNFGQTWAPRRLCWHSHVAITLFMYWRCDITISLANVYNIIIRSFLASALVKTFVTGASFNQSKSKELAWDFNSVACDRRGSSSYCYICSFAHTSRWWS